MVDGVLDYFFQELERRHPGGWLVSRRPLSGGTGRGEVIAKFLSLGISLSDRYKLRLAGIDSLSQLLEYFSLKGIRLDSHMGLLGWSTGKYPLHLRHDIPTPEEMLDVQCRGERLVTWLIRPEEQFAPIGRHAGAFEFLLHDLEHAHKFFGDPFLYHGQTQFFLFLREILPHFRHFMRDPLFVKDLNYLKSDMNSHPFHMFKYLKAIHLTAHLRESQDRGADLNGFWMEVLKAWPGERLEAALRINHPGKERPEDPALVSGFFADL